VAKNGSKVAQMMVRADMAVVSSLLDDAASLSMQGDLRHVRLLFAGVRFGWVDAHANPVARCVAALV
jgi:hypothetical protein